LANTTAIPHGLWRSAAPLAMNDFGMGKCLLAKAFKFEVLPLQSRVARTAMRTVKALIGGLLSLAPSHSQ